MRNLDTINPAFLKPSKISWLSAFILCAMALLSMPLAYGVAPNISLAANPIFLLNCMALAGSLIVLSVPAIFGWGWRAQYYGVSFLCVASVSFLAIVPCMAVVLYGTASGWVKFFLVFVYGTSHYLWCRKFTSLYKKIFNDEILRSSLYEEEPGAIYYMRRGDEFILKKYYKFSQMPRDRYFVLFVLAALLLIPMMRTVSAFVGAPFVHVFPDDSNAARKLDEFWICRPWISGLLSVSGTDKEGNRKRRLCRLGQQASATCYAPSR